MNNNRTLLNYDIIVQKKSRKRKVGEPHAAREPHFAHRCYNRFTGRRPTIGLIYQCNARAIIFKFNQNSFYGHVFNKCRFAIVSFFSLWSNVFSFYADLGRNKMNK